MKRIGFTGTQRGMTAEQMGAVTTLLQTYRDQHNGVEFHHGDCVGADRDADIIASALGITRVIHPPSISAKRAWCVAETVLSPKPYLERNHDIVNAVEIMLATPGEYMEQLRSGTWATVRYTRKLGRILHLIQPDGSVK